MSRRQYIILAAFGSLALLAGAFLFQFVGFTPCAMCLWQRWPHGAAIVIGVLALSMGRPGPYWGLLGAASVLVSGAIGLWQTGMERDWWEGPASCSSSGGLGADLLSTQGANVVMCDVVSLQIFGLSMASWNVIASLVLAAIWLTASLRR